MQKYVSADLWEESLFQSGIYPKGVTEPFVYCLRLLKILWTEGLMLHLDKDRYLKTALV